MRAITVSSCNLNQWSLDFMGNRDRIIRAISDAHRQGAKLLITPELSISGYDCLNEFLQLDATRDSWEVPEELLTECIDIICDVGMVSSFPSHPVIVCCFKTPPISLFLFFDSIGVS